MFYYVHGEKLSWNSCINTMTFQTTNDYELVPSKSSSYLHVIVILHVSVIVGKEDYRAKYKCIYLKLIEREREREEMVCVCNCNIVSCRELSFFNFIVFINHNLVVGYLVGSKV